MRVPPEMVLPVFVSVVLFIALLIGYPWYILSAGTVLYLLSLPAGWKSHRDHQRRAASQAATHAAGQPAQAPQATPSDAARPFVGGAAETHEDDRPARLN
jgi:CDP-diacylglycerol--serine O-phosphatidyltransferase